MGETEKNLRRALGIAESMAPVVLWIDELEKSLSSGGELDGGVSKRVLATFLTWLQEKKQEVFVVATANDVFALPPELLRKGRFDEIFFVDLPDGAERQEILRIHLSHRKQEVERFDLTYLADATEGWSGAELEQAVTAALYDSLHKKRPLDTTLLLQEIGSTVPALRLAPRGRGAAARARTRALRAGALTGSRRQARLTCRLRHASASVKGC